MTTMMTTTNTSSYNSKIKPVIKNKQQLLDRIVVLRKEKKKLEIDLKNTLNSVKDKFSPSQLLGTAADTFKEQPDGGIVGKASAGLIDILLKNILANTKIGFLKKIALQSLAPYASNAIVNLIKKTINKPNITNDK
jgi:hypothetical protein